jgi:hypothetical protein
MTMATPCIALKAGDDAAEGTCLEKVEDLSSVHHSFQMLEFQEPPC